MVKKFAYIILPIALILVFILLNHNKPQVKISPSGLFYLTTEINKSKYDIRLYLCVKIIIKDKQGKLIQEIQTYASDRMKWNVGWGEKDSIILESSDIGDWEWKMQENNKWKN